MTKPMSREMALAVLSQIPFAPCSYIDDQGKQVDTLTACPAENITDAIREAADALGFSNNLSDKVYGSEQLLKADVKTLIEAGIKNQVLEVFASEQNLSIKRPPAQRFL